MSVLPRCLRSTCVPSILREFKEKKKKGRRINPPGTEVTDAVSHHWVLGPKHRSSVSTARALDH